MIENVTSFTRKSFKNYTGPDDKFKQKNVIFGYNGRGKSSLAYGLEDKYLSDFPKNQDKVRFFNKDYIEDNLRLQDPATGARSKNKIKGVIAHFSAKDIKSQEKIAELENNVVDVSPLQVRIDELKTDVRQAIDAIHDRRKGTANIAKKNKEFDIDKVIELYTQDLNDARKIEADDTRLSKIEGDNLIGEKIELLKTLEFYNFNKISEKDFTDIQELFDKSFSNISVPSSRVVDWLNEGLEVHEDGDDCKFCGGKLALHDISKKVEEYNANEKQKATKNLQSFDEKIAELQNTIKANLDNKDTIQTALDADVKIGNSYKFIEESSVGITNSRNVVQAKIKNIDRKSTFSNFKGDMQKFNDAVNELTQVKNTQLTKLEEQNSNKDTLVKGAIGLEIINDSSIKSKLVEITKKTKELGETNAKNSKLKIDIQKLKQSENATSDFADYISDILTNLAINLKLTVSEDGKNYIIQHTQTGTELTISDISEGERNLLALLFFYYELFNDSNQQDFKSDVELIIVDDPVSSMDDINKMYILVLIKQLLDIESPQVFVMTHSWEDFTKLCYGYQDKPATPANPATPYGFYEIKKDSDSKSLVVKTKSNITPYHHNFIEVYEFAQKQDTSNLDDCEIFHIPNILRQVLEGFLKFKIRDPSPTKNNEKQIARVLFAQEWAVLRQDKKTKLGQLLTTINVNSHGSVKNPDEILVSAKFLMNRIKQVDEQHYNTNKEPVI